MPRLSRELVAARESFVTQAFKEGKSIEEVQKMLVEVGPGGKTGMRMFAPRIEQLFKEATGGLPSTIKPAPVPTQAPKEKAAPKVKAKPVEAPPETKVTTCAVEYVKGKECGKPVTVYANSQGKNLPVCPDCKRSGVVAVIRRVA